MIPESLDQTTAGNNGTKLQQPPRQREERVVLDCLNLSAVPGQGEGGGVGAKGGERRGGVAPDVWGVGQPGIVIGLVYVTCLKDAASMCSFVDLSMSVKV